MVESHSSKENIKGVYWGFTIIRIKSDSGINGIMQKHNDREVLAMRYTPEGKQH